MFRNRADRFGTASDQGRRVRRWLVGLVAAGLLAIGVAACGSSDPTPLPPTATPAPTATPVPTATPEPEPGTIVDIAVGDERFETLQGEGPFTVFAPTDDAFATLPEGTVEALLADLPALTDILLYHVVAGNAKAADVVTLDLVTTVQGDAVNITVDGDTVLLNEARVLITDIEAANGTIHVIDSVLIPPEES